LDRPSASLWLGAADKDDYRDYGYNYGDQKKGDDIKKHGDPFSNNNVEQHRCQTADAK
jgi:hypothetical protein